MGLTKLLSFIDAKFRRKDGKEDYCSVSPDVWFNVDISQACRVHDEHYAKQDISRIEADTKLKDQIIKIGKGKLKFKIIGWLYYYGVRVGGSIWGW